MKSLKTLYTAQLSGYLLSRKFLAKTLKGDLDLAASFFERATVVNNLIDKSQFRDDVRLGTNTGLGLLPAETTAGH